MSSEPPKIRAATIEELPAVEFYAPPPPLPPTNHDKPPILLDQRDPPSGRSHTRGSNSPFDAQHIADPANNCDPKGLLVVAVLIPFLLFLITGPTQGDVSWGVVMLLVGGSITLGWYGFLGLAKLSTQRGEEMAFRAIKVFLGTAAIGVMLLLLFQEAVILFDKNWNYPLIKIIATGYRTVGLVAELPHPLRYFFCTLCSVAPCEELVKLLPVLLMYCGSDTSQAKLFPNKYSQSQGLLFLGAISGLGFGVSEGLMFTADHYWPSHSGFTDYFLRFMCLALLHGLWSFLSTAMYLHKQSVSSPEQKSNYWLLWVLLGPMCLHSLYNTAITYDWNFVSLVVVGGTIAATLAISIALRVSPEETSKPEELIAK